MLNVPGPVMALLANKAHLPINEQIFGQIYNSFGHRKLKPLMKNAGVKLIKMRSFRHTFATHFLLTHGGKEIKKLQEILGHRKFETTSKYLHYVKTENDQAIADKTVEGASWLNPSSNVVHIGNQCTQTAP